MRARNAVRAAAGAVTFLTILPLGRLVELDESDVARGAPFFPLVGAALGGAVGLAVVALDDVLPVFVAAALAVALETILTGALHLDALADTADGLGANTRERALEIMRDAQIGSFGAAALVLDLLVKVAVVVAVVELEGTILLLVAVWAVGRSAPLALAFFLPYARAEPGSGRTLTDGAGRLRLLFGLAVGLAVAVVAAGSRAPALLAAAGFCVLLAGFVARARFGGVTGDVLGASVEVTTTIALVGAVATA
jgi:adenosylcobinamide-GDP ribazoletransferase